MIALLAQGIPEETAVVTLAFVIAKIPLLKWNKVLLIGVLLAISMYVIRLCPIPFGIHTILVILLLTAFLIQVGKKDIGLSFFASLVTTLAVAVLEYSCMSVFVVISGFTPETIFNDIVIRIVVGDTHVLLIFVLAFLLLRFPEKRRTLEFNESTQQPK